MDTVDVAGVRTTYLEAGTGSAVVLLHGSGPGVSAASNWAGVIGALGARHRVLAPDMPGFGFTDFRPDGDYDIKVWTGHLLGFLDALGLERVALVGNSLGGAVALALALRHAERIERIVAMGTPVGEYPITPGLAAGRAYEPSPEAMRAVMEHFPYDPSLIDDAMVQARFAASDRPGAQDAMRCLLPAPAADGGETIVRGLPESALAHVAMPVLILHGREDRVIPFEHALRLHRGIADSELHAFGRCGHWVQLERRDGFVRQVLGFLGDGAPAGR
ncbi:MAG TPA: alpha/beta fold hydrolase [Conexibacter sp.]|nr:alpha/beta fold hydrolase [Conexibacter sp.]